MNDALSFRQITITPLTIVILIFMDIIRTITVTGTITITITIMDIMGMAIITGTTIIMAMAEARRMERMEVMVADTTNSR